MTTEREQLVLSGGDAALVIKETGEIIVHITRDHLMGRPTLAVIGCAWALEDEAWRNAVIDSTARTVQARIEDWLRVMPPKTGE